MEKNSSVESTLGHIKSFVIRTTRMSPAQKRGWDQYADDFVIPFQPGAEIDTETVFPGRGSCPLILDIGFGMGRELAELAELNQDVNYLGVEVHKPGIGRLLLDLGERKIDNVRIIPHDAVEVCRHMIAAGLLDGIHLFFPDPWPKARHHKRRLVRPGFPDMVAPLVKTGGYLYIVTDWEDYARQILGVMDDSPAFVNDNDGFAPPQPWRPETAFERKGRAKGHTIFEFVYRRFSRSTFT